MPRGVLAFVFAGGLLCLPVLARAQDNPLSSCKVSRMDKEAYDGNPVADVPNVFEWKFVGSVKIVCDDTTIDADEVHYRDDQDIVYASGHVVFTQKGTRISADRAQLDRKTHQGTFFDAIAILQLSNTGVDRSMFGGMEPDAVFYGERIEKIGDRMYKLTNGAFTTCDQPTPRWEMAASSVVFVPDKHAILKNMVLKVKDVPVFYVPAFYYPINKENRATGFLMPQYGSSTVGGFTLGNAFFWAINRSQDATFFHDFYSRTGQSYATEYRYAEAPGSDGRAYFRMFNEKPLLAPDGVTVTTPARRSFNIQGNMSQALGAHVRASARTDFFSSVETQQLFQQNIEERSRRTRTSGGEIYGIWKQYRVSGRVALTDTFYGLSAQRQGVAPQVSFGIAEKPIGRSPVYFGLASDFASFLRQTDLSTPTPATSLNLRRLDFNPVVRVPLSRWPFLTVTTNASLRLTRWSDSLENDTQVDVPIRRSLFEYTASVTGPMFTRIFNTPTNGYAEKFKHLIAPSFSIQRFTPFDESARIVKLDYIDQITGGFTQMRYGLTNRILAKRKQSPTGSSEILSVDVSQSYYSVSTAAIADQENQSSLETPPTSNFSPIRMNVNAHPSDDTSGQFQLEYDHQFGALRRMGASGTLNTRVVQATAGWSKRFVIPKLPAYSIGTHSLNASVTIRKPEGHIGGSWSWLWDVQQRVLQHNRITGFYNSQCCGIAAEYQREVFAQAIHGIAVDRRINFSFMLAGLGTFSNPLGSFLGR